jgi:hypothetical protein
VNCTSRANFVFGVHVPHFKRPIYDLFGRYEFFLSTRRCPEAIYIIIIIIIIIIIVIMQLVPLGPYYISYIYVYESP